MFFLKKNEALKGLQTQTLDNDSYAKYGSIFIMPKVFVYLKQAEKNAGSWWQVNNTVQLLSEKELT